MARFFYLIILITAFAAGCNTVEPQGSIPSDTTRDAHSVEDSARGIIDRANERFHTPEQTAPDSNQNR